MVMQIFNSGVPSHGSICGIMSTLCDPIEIGQVLEPQAPNVIVKGPLIRARLLLVPLIFAVCANEGAFESLIALHEGYISELLGLILGNL